MKRLMVVMTLGFALAPASLVAMRSNHAGWHGAAPNMHPKQAKTRNNKVKQTIPAGVPVGFGI
jgi:hypothetical protein